MRTFMTLWKRELASYFLSPIAYITTAFFLAVMGFSFWILTVILAQGVEGVSVMKILFGESIFFWIALLIVVPLITMRLYADEFRQGTIETLMTAPVYDTTVVLAKYFGALTFFMIMWLPTGSYVFILRAFSPYAPIDLGPMMTSYLGAFLMGAFYISIGLLTSSMTRNQIVASIVSFAFICIAFFAGFIHYFSTGELAQQVGWYLSSVEHMREFSRGIIDTRPIVLYLTGTALMLFATVKIVSARRWK